MTDRELQLKSVALRCNSKPLEFERFGNCGEFAIIKKSGGRSMAVLIPSNSTELELAAGVVPRD